MLICVGGREERNNSPKKHTHRQKERQEKKYVVAVGGGEGGGGEKKQSLRLRHPPCLPPPSWKHRVRALPLHVLIMINAGSTTHTETTVLAGFCHGSLLRPVVLRGAVHTPIKNQSQ